MDWFNVQFDESIIKIFVNPPERKESITEILWENIIRVCFKTADLFDSDEVHLFTNERKESYVIPTEAIGGLVLWNEIIKRGLFDADLAIRIASSTKEGIHCWPES